MSYEITNIKSEMNGKKIANYLLRNKLGEGQFASVWKARCINTGKSYAIKKIDKAKLKANNLLEMLITEVTIMSTINHPNILHLYDFFETDHNYYLIVDLCHDGDFDKFLKAQPGKCLAEQNAIFYLKQIANGFQELRKHLVIHRDLKLANIFKRDDVVVIGDFGFSKYGKEFTSTKLGTPLCMAPEVMDPDHKNYDSKTDIWSLGVAFYVMLFGVYPFKGNELVEIWNSIQARAGSKLPFPKEVSDDAKDLLVRMLTIDPKQRMDWSEFFNHRLFSQKMQGAPNLIENTLMKLGQTIDYRVVTDGEFERNRKSVKEMIDPQLKAPNTSEKQIISCKKIDEEELNQNQCDSIICDIFNKEIEFRYNHEKNKIFFLNFTTKEVQKIFKAKPALEICCNLYLLARILFRKSILLNREMIDSIKKKENKFKLHDRHFEDFLKSEFYYLVLKNFEEKHNDFEQYFKLMKDRAPADPEVAKYDALIEAPQTRLPDLDKLLDKFYEIMITQIDVIPENKRTDYLKATLCTKLCKDLDTRFPYLLIPNNFESKFAWDKFFSEIKNADEDICLSLI